MDSLEPLRGMDPARPSVRRWNAMIEAVQARTVLPGVDFGGRRTDFPHPWRTVAGKWEDVPEALKYPKGRTWRVAVAPGTVNDELATIIYRKTNDERGWKMPTDYPAPAAGHAGFMAAFVDRPLLDTQEEPPFLVVVTPPATGPVEGSFLPVPDAGRLPFFQTEAMWQKLLYRSYIVLSSDPGVSRFYLPQMPVTLRRFRVVAGPQLPPRGPAQNGGYLTLARLWLTRDADTGDPESDEIYVQQLVYWCVGTRVALDSFSLPGGLDLPLIPSLAGAAAGAFGEYLSISAGLLQDQLNEIYAAAARVTFWSH